MVSNVCCSTTSITMEKIKKFSTNVKHGLLIGCQILKKFDNVLQLKNIFEQGILKGEVSLYP